MKVQYSERCTIMDGQRAGSHAIATCEPVCVLMHVCGCGSEVSGDSAIHDV